MEQNRHSRVWEIWEAGQSDPQYGEMLAQIRILEKKYDAVLQTLSSEQRNIVCDYVMLCEDMSWRMLEIACEVNETPGV